jgi:hypothetical protein
LKNSKDISVEINAPMIEPGIENITIFNPVYHFSGGYFHLHPFIKTRLFECPFSCWRILYRRSDWSYTFKLSKRKGIAEIAIDLLNSSCN